MPNDASAQPMILVKKADGTSVRMFLDDVKKMKAAEKKAKAPAPTPTKPLEPITIEDKDPFDLAQGKEAALRRERLASWHQPIGSNQIASTPPQINRIKETKKQEPIDPAARVAAWQGQEKKEMKTTPPEPVSVPSAPQAPSRAIHVESSQTLTNTTPVRESFVNEAIASIQNKKPFGSASFATAQDKQGKQEQKQRTPAPIVRSSSRVVPKKSTIAIWTNDDHQSLLDETDVPSAPTVSGNRGENEKNIAIAVMQQLPFSLSEDLLPHLEALVKSRMTGVRTHEQSLKQAMKPVEQGGLGLDEAQALLLADQLDTIARVPAEVLMKDASPLSLPEKHAPAAPDEHIQSDQQNFQPQEEVFRMKSDTAAMRQPMHDVRAVPQEKRTTGPVEEISRLSLADFRQLGATPGASVSVLYEKFTTAREETYLNYLDMKHAWKESPLFQDYVHSIKNALMSGQTIAQYLTEQKKNDRQAMSIEEYSAMVDVNKQLT